MQLEAIEPTHSAFTHLCKSFKSFVAFDTFVMAYTQNSAVNKRNTGTRAFRTVMQIQHKGNGTAVAKLYKTIVRNQCSELFPEMYTHILRIEKFKIGKAATMKSD